MNKISKWLKRILFGEKTEDTIEYEYDTTEYIPRKWPPTPVDPNSGKPWEDRSWLCSRCIMTITLKQDTCDVIRKNLQNPGTIITIKCPKCNDIVHVESHQEANQNPDSDGCYTWKDYEER